MVVQNGVLHVLETPLGLFLGLVLDEAVAQIKALFAHHSGRHDLDLLVLEMLSELRVAGVEIQIFDKDDLVIVVTLVYILLINLLDLVLLLQANLHRRVF